MIRLDPRTAEDYKDWGRAEDKENRAKAVDRLEEMLLQAKAERRRIPSRAPPCTRRANLDKAIAEYDKALELYPRYTEVYYNRGLAYRKKDNLAKAIADYTQPSAWTPSTSPPMPTAAMPTTSRASSTRRWPTSTRSSSWIPTTPTRRRAGK